VVVVVVMMMINASIIQTTEIITTKYHAMKTYRGSGGMDLCTLNLDTRWR
jgi:hypothetical protein